MKKKLIVELIGTFFLVFTVGCAAVLGLAGARGAMAPLAIGSVLMAMVFAGGHISGAMYNPAVSLAVMLRGKLPAKEFVAYIIVQLVGAILAALFVTKVIGAGAEIRLAEIDLRPALTAEFFFTFALCYVVLNVATAKGTEGNSFYGLAIGFTVMAGAFAVGSVSLGVFNPAVGAGLLMMGKLKFGTLLFYMVVQFVAAGAAAIVFQQVNSE